MKQTTNLEKQFSEEEIELQNLKGRLQKYMTGTTKGFKHPLIAEQQQILKDYYKYLLTENPKVNSILTYIDIMRILSLYGAYINKPYNEVTKEELIDYFFYLHNGGRQKSTINEYKMKIKAFYKFLYGTKDYPEVVDWITITAPKPKNLSDDELLSRTDIKRMLNACDNPRDRAIIKVLFESAARRAEILSCDIRHATPDRYGFKLKLPKSKTKDRTVRLIDSVPELQKWLNEHPYKDKPFSPLFPNIKKYHGKRMTAAGFANIIRKIAIRAKIEKKVNIHLFRHSRLNELGNSGFNERDLRIVAGWAEDSKMPKVYLHYGEKEVDRKMLEQNGLLDEEESKEEIKDKESLTPRKCPRCSKINESINTYCGSCGMALNLKEYMDDQEIVKEETDNRLKVYADIMANPEKRKQFEEFKKLVFKE